VQPRTIQNTDGKISGLRVTLGKPERKRHGEPPRDSSIIAETAVPTPSPILANSGGEDERMIAWGDRRVRAGETT
jgi:hypothetical protein